MGRTIRMPLGRVPEDQIRPGIDAAVNAIATALKQQHENATKIETDLVMAQNEVARDNKTVKLKLLKMIVKLRIGSFAGANVTMTWHRDRPTEVAVKMNTMSVFEDWCFVGAVAAAMVATIWYSLKIRVVANFIVFPVFAAALLVCLIPYYGLSYVMARAGDALLDSVEGVVRSVVAPG